MAQGNRKVIIAIGIFVGGVTLFSARYIQLAHIKPEAEQAERTSVAQSGRSDFLSPSFKFPAEFTVTVPGSYRPVDSLAGWLPPVVACSVELSENERDSLEETAGWLFRELARTPSSVVSEESPPMELLPSSSNPSMTMDKLIRFHRESSPNYHWDSVNIDSSQITVAPVSDLQCWTDEAVRAVMERRISEHPDHQGSETLYVAMDFYVGHAGDGKNRLTFFFEFVEDRSALRYSSTMETNRMSVASANTSR